MLFRSDCDVTKSNISVLLPVYTATQDAALLVYNMNDHKRHLIAAKGVFAEFLPRTPELEDGTSLDKFPEVSYEQLQKLPIYKYPKVSTGTIQLGDGRVLNIEEFLRISDPSTLGSFSKDDITNILGVLNTLGRRLEARQMFNRLNAACTIQKNARVEAAADTGSIQYLIEQLRVVDRDSTEAARSEEHTSEL